MDELMEGVVSELDHNSLNEVLEQPSRSIVTGKQSHLVVVPV